MTDIYKGIIQELESIITKRNTAMTIIESNDITKTLNHIKKQIMCIKHESKRGQLMYLYNILNKNVSLYVKLYNKKTGIFCIGELVDKQIYYKEINIIPPYSSYDYDDIFHTFKIAQILFNIQLATNQEIKKLEDLFIVGNKNYHDAKYFFDNQIDDNMDEIKIIYHITTTKELSNIPSRWFGKKEIKLIVDHMFNSTSPLSMCTDIGI